MCKDNYIEIRFKMYGKSFRQKEIMKKYLLVHSLIQPNQTILNTSKVVESIYN